MSLYVPLLCQGGRGHGFNRPGGNKRNSTQDRRSIGKNHVGDKRAKKKREVHSRTCKQTIVHAFGCRTCHVEASSGKLGFGITFPAVRFERYLPCHPSGLATEIVEDLVRRRPNRKNAEVGKQACSSEHQAGNRNIELAGNWVNQVASDCLLVRSSLRRKHQILQVVLRGGFAKLLAKAFRSYRDHFAVVVSAPCKVKGFAPKQRQPDTKAT